MRIKSLRLPVVVHKGQEISSEVLDAVVSGSRVLWAFIKRNGEIMAVPYSEEQVIWIQPADLERSDGEEPQ